jgi:hypothetical protein
MTTEVDRANEIVQKFTAYIQQRGGIPSQWNVGIVNSPDRLFSGHGVSRENDAWIYDTAPNSDLARQIEASFHAWGCKGGAGGGNNDTRIVYAYRITRR